MPTDRQINYIEFYAADLDQIEAFYSETFGWQFTSYGPQYRAFNDGTMDGGFELSADKRSSADTGGALVVLYAEELESTRDRVIKNGGRIHKDIFDFPGGRRFQFFDPHGNELAVWSEK